MKKEFLDPIIELVNFDENVVLNESNDFGGGTIYGTNNDMDLG